MVVVPGEMLSSFVTSTTSSAAEATKGQVVGVLTTQGTQSEVVRIQTDSTVNGVVIGLLSSFGSAALICLVALCIWWLRYTSSGRIVLDSIGRVGGAFDDAEAYAKEEAEALEQMDDLQRTEYFRAKAFIQANPPDSAATDISLSQYMAIQEKGVSAWEFEPELEIANCFVEGRTEIEFFDSECSTLTNLPIPKQNEVYYWESKIYDKPETTLISIGVATKPYPLFRLPGIITPHMDLWYGANEMQDGINTRLHIHQLDIGGTTNRSTDQPMDRNMYKVM